MHNILEGGREGREVTWVCDSLEWTVKLRACEHGSAQRSHSGEEPPAGYNMQLKVGPSLGNSLTMFVTADDSAWVENKRVARGSALNGAEEWLREMVGAVAQVAMLSWTEMEEAGVWQEKQRIER